MNSTVDGRTNGHREHYIVEVRDLLSGGMFHEQSVFEVENGPNPSTKTQHVFKFRKIGMLFENSS